MTVAQLISGVLAIASCLSVVMSMAWIAEQRTGNSGWIDTIWTFGLGAIGIAAALWPVSADASISARQWIVAAAVAVWCARLGLHIARRSLARRDDPRYAKLRAEWGESARGQMWILLQKQAIVSIPMGASIWLAAHNPAPDLRVQDYVAALILIVAFGGEAIADRQLGLFARANRGSSAVCQIGLWRWSRHPNYFFEWFGWLAYPMIAIDLSGSYPFGWLALTGPACMYWLLVFVSGIPPLEEHMLRTRGETFRRYQESTSAFFPLPAGAKD